MGRLHKDVLPTAGAGGERVYGCAACHAHLSSAARIVSKAFQGRNGRAFLFASAVNVTAGPREERQLMTGLHVVTDLFCAVCQHPVGWQCAWAARRARVRGMGGGRDQAPRHRPR
jgi:hypothetical protein